MKAMILAAGLGTRLRPLTENIPKPMVPVAGVPNIERIIVHLRNQGIVDFAVNLHHCPEPLKAHLKTGAHLGVDITYFEEPHILGTGGGIKNMLPHMGDDTFVVVNGDMLFMPEIAPIEKAHKSAATMASMVLSKSDDAKNPGNVGLNKLRQVKRLRAAGDKSINDLYVFTGMHIVDPHIAERLPDKGCIVGETYVPMVENGETILGIVSDDAFTDLGTPADYLDANLAIAKGDILLPGFKPQPNQSIIDDTVEIGRGVTLKNCIIGKNATVGSEIRVIESIVMADAVVKTNIRRKIVLADGTHMDADTASN